MAFVFRLMEGMTTEEVAAALWVSTSTAKRLVNRASAKVFERVSEDPGLRSFFALSAAEERG
jgi:DNA-directed RNA polymerase specialized sigma24 family protein